MTNTDAWLQIRVTGVAGLEVGQARKFQFVRETADEEGFVLRLSAGFVAYLNRCPHWNVDLDLGDGRFYDAELDRIYCKNHGALFEPGSGRCDSGPCLSRSLERFDLALDGTDAIVSIPRDALSR